MKSRDRPEKVRVLHVVSALSRGGIETWLMHVLRNTDLDRFSIDFLTHTPDPAPYDDEARSLGCGIHFCAPCVQPLRYAMAFRRIMDRYGPYHVAHSHLAHFSGYVLKLAASAGIPVRIAHIHNSGADGLTRSTSLPRWKRSYRSLMKRMIRKHATHLVANSGMSGEFLFGPRWRANPRSRLLLYGFDFSRYGSLPDRSARKTQLGIPPHRRVVGHVGRFQTQKNHAFLVRVFKAMLDEGVDGHLLMVGQGPLEGEVRNQVRSLGLESRVLMAGEQADVSLFFAAMDVMVFPSFHEGLGIVVLEAQAAGVPTVGSTGVPPEACVVAGMVKLLPLDSTEKYWAREIDAFLDADRMDPRRSLDEVNRSSYAIGHCVQALSSIYAGPTASARG